jgi:cytochrome b involved in lipid metabolism
VKILMASDTQKPTSSRAKVMLKPGFHLVDWMRQMQAIKGMSGKLRKISCRELAEHKSQFDCWTAYKGKVYNITQYLPYHPGGIPVLMQAAGKDCTALFNKYHSWVNAESMLSKCIIGVMMTEEEEKALDVSVKATERNEEASAVGGTQTTAGPDVSGGVGNPQQNSDQKESSLPEVVFSKLDLSSVPPSSTVLSSGTSIYGEGADATPVVLDALSDNHDEDKKKR